VRPRTQTTLVAEVSGKIIAVSDNFVAGGFFRSGETLLEIDPSDYRTAVKRAEAALASRRAQLADEEARSRQAVKDWKNLGRTGDPPALVAREPQLADARANVLAAEADLEKAQRDLQRTRISLPYDGVVRQRQADLGQFVAPGTQVGATFSVGTAEVRLPVSPTDLAFLELPTPGTGLPEDPAVVELATEEAGRTLTWEARLVRTEGVLDEQSRVLYAIAEITDPYGIQGLTSQPVLRMGTFVRASIEGRYLRDVVILPRYVLRNDGTVLVANAERELEVRPVTVVRAEPDLVYISDGIADGEQVITTTLEAPIPGTRLVLSGEGALQRGDAGVRTIAARQAAEAAEQSTGRAATTPADPEAGT
jgi:RND family efflux transporter MFP subunit